MSRRDRKWTIKGRGKSYVHVFVHDDHRVSVSASGSFTWKQVERIGVAMSEAAAVAEMMSALEGRPERSPVARHW